MGQMFHPDSRLMRILSTASSFIALNLLWLLCSLPVFTVGAATTAMYTVERKIARREDPTVAPEFFRAFRENFKKSLPLMPLLLLLALASVCYFLSDRGLLRAPNWFSPLCLVALIVVSVVWAYVWPLMAWFENSIGNTLRNAMLLPFGNPLVAALATALNLLPLWLIYRHTEAFLRIGILWIAAGFSLTAFVNTQLLRLQLRRYFPADEFTYLRPREEEDTEKSEPETLSVEVPTDRKDELS